MRRLEPRSADVEALPPPYRRFWDEARAVLPPERLFCDPLRTLAYGTDASFYRLVPRIVARVATVAEVQALALGYEFRFPAIDGALKELLR